jgi:hypothetical protein
MRHKTLALAAVAALTTVLLPGITTMATPSAGQKTPVAVGAVADGPVALHGAAAASYRVPADMESVWQATYPDGTTQTRY